MAGAVPDDISGALAIQTLNPLLEYEGMAEMSPSCPGLVFLGNSGSSQPLAKHISAAAKGGAAVVVHVEEVEGKKYAVLAVANVEGRWWLAAAPEPVVAKAALQPGPGGDEELAEWARAAWFEAALDEGEDPKLPAKTKAWMSATWRTHHSEACFKRGMSEEAYVGARPKQRCA